MYENQYAETHWTEEDLMVAHPEIGFETARKWWQENEKGFLEALIQYGNEILADVVAECAEGR